MKLTLEFSSEEEKAKALPDGDFAARAVERIKRMVQVYLRSTDIDAVDIAVLVKNGDIPQS